MNSFENAMEDESPPKVTGTRGKIRARNKRRLFGRVGTRGTQTTGTVQSSFNEKSRNSTTMENFGAANDSAAEEPENFYAEQPAARQMASKMNLPSPTDKYTRMNENERERRIKENKKAAKCWPKLKKKVKDLKGTKLQEEEQGEKEESEIDEEILVPGIDYQED